MPPKIFLDSGDPAETRHCLDLLGSLDGQTTNPTLVSKHPVARERFQKGKKFTPKEIMDFYKQVVNELSGLIPDGSISIEVYADKNTTDEQMVAQGRAMFGWIPNAHIKLPVNAAGLRAAEALIHDGIRVNMTLCFSQEQAAAVYAATRHAKPGQVFVSPFIGRHDDQGQSGVDLVRNICTMYQDLGDGHVEVLAASVRTAPHFYASLQLGTDIITAPASLLCEWAERGKKVPDDFVYDPGALTRIPYRHIDLNLPWTEYDIDHPLTDKGLERFSSDWNQLIKA